MNRNQIATNSALLIATTVLAVQSIRTERRLSRLENTPPPSMVAAENSSSRTKGPANSNSKPTADSDSIASLASRHEEARSEVAELRNEVARLRGELAETAVPGSRLIERRGDPDLFTGFVPQQERIELWNGGPKRSWGHEQAAGEPDTLEPGDIPSAWASKSPDSGEEWLKLDYDRLVDLQQIRVFESHNPGAISKVAALLPDGSETTLWEGTLDPSDENEVVTSEFLVNTTVRAKSVKVYLDTARVPGWNEIDAVQLVGRDGSRQWASASSSSTSYADP